MGINICFATLTHILPTHQPKRVLGCACKRSTCRWILPIRCIKLPGLPVVLSIHLVTPLAHAIHVARHSRGTAQQGSICSDKMKYSGSRSLFYAIQQYLSCPLSTDIMPQRPSKAEQSFFFFKIQPNHLSSIFQRFSYFHCFLSSLVVATLGTEEIREKISQGANSLVWLFHTLRGVSRACPAARRAAGRPLGEPIVIVMGGLEAVVMLSPRAIHAVVCGAVARSVHGL